MLKLITHVRNITVVHLFSVNFLPKLKRMKLELLAVIINKNMIGIKENKETKVILRTVTYFLSNFIHEVTVLEIDFPKSELWCFSWSSSKRKTFQNSSLNMGFFFRKWFQVNMEKGKIRQCKNECATVV